MLETAQPSGGAATRQSAAQAEQYKVDLHSQVGLASRKASDGWAAVFIYDPSDCHPSPRRHPPLPGPAPAHRGLRPRDPRALAVLRPGHRGGAVGAARHRRRRAGGAAGAGRDRRPPARRPAHAGAPGDLSRWPPRSAPGRSSPPTGCGCTCAKRARDGARDPLHPRLVAELAELAGPARERARRALPPRRLRPARPRHVGRTARARGLHRGPRWADDVDALITELELDRPILVGWSFGGYVTCDYIRAHGQGRWPGSTSSTGR